MPKPENDGLTEFEQDLYKSIEELNDDIDTNTEAMQEEIDDFEPDAFLKGVHDDDWEDEEEDEDFALGEEEEGEDEEDEYETKKKKKKKMKSGSKFSKDEHGLDPSLSNMGIGMASKAMRAMKIKPDPRLNRILQNQVALGSLLKGLSDILIPTGRQVANIAECMGYAPRVQKHAKVGGQAESDAGMPEDVAKAVEEVGFIGVDTDREKAIDEAFAKGLLPDGLTDMAASALYREDRNAFIQTIAPVLVKMRRDAAGK